MNDVMNNIIKIISTENEDISEKMDMNTNIESLNMGSLEFVTLFAQIEEQFQIEFTMDDMVDDSLATIGDLVDRVLELIEVRQFSETVD